MGGCFSRVASRPLADTRATTRGAPRSSRCSRAGGRSRRARPSSAARCSEIGKAPSRVERARRADRATVRGALPRAPPADLRAHGPPVRRPHAVPVAGGHRRGLLGLAADLDGRREPDAHPRVGGHLSRWRDDARSGRPRNRVAGQGLHAPRRAGRADEHVRVADPPVRGAHRDALPRLRLPRLPRLLPRLEGLRARDFARRTDHFLRGVYWPQSVYVLLTPSPWRWLEHAAWVAFEDTFMI